MPEPASPRNYLEQYERDGFVGPVTLVAPGDVEAIAQEVLALNNEDFAAAQRNRHLKWECARQLAKSPALITLAENILGPNLILWRSNLFKGTPGHGLPWHQDQYTRLLANPLQQLSIHIALTPAPIDNCLLLIPGSHLMTHEQLAEIGFNYINGSGTKNYGTPRFWRAPTASANMVRMILQPGECFAFHPLLLHASSDLTTAPETPAATAKPATHSAPTRIGFSLRITTAQNEVFPFAFAEPTMRGDHCVPLTS